MLERALALKERLRAGGTVIGAWLGFNDPALIEVMARAGYDYLLIDTEHTPWSLERCRRPSWPSTVSTPCR